MKKVLTLTPLNRLPIHVRPSPRHLFSRQRDLSRALHFDVAGLVTGKEPGTRASPEGSNGLNAYGYSRRSEQWRGTSGRKPKFEALLGQVATAIASLSAGTLLPSEWIKNYVPLDSGTEIPIPFTDSFRDAFTECANGFMNFS